MDSESSSDKKNSGKSLGLEFSNKQQYAVGALTILTVAIFVLTILPSISPAGFVAASASSHSGSVDMDKIISQVVPDAGFKVDVKWGGVVKAMVDQGAIDVKKFEDLLSKRYGQKMKAEWLDILNGKDANLEINAGNSVFMMYVLWALAKHNDNKILHDSPFAADFGKDYDIGVGKKGYGDLKLISLTPEQQAIAKNVAENAYRPCCGQSTARPDCSHGFSALGLVQLMASQGFKEKDIFDAFVKFNSFWFPANYIQDALYFKVTENQDWNQVDRQLVSGPQFSSVSGAAQVKKALTGAGY